MSASDAGYRGTAKWFNDRGWNAVFPHLPFHYSRKPRGFFNGELAVTANLIRTGETLRQGVTELRQLMQILRDSGSREFGILGTSYGGWTAALLSFLEELRFLALIQPIVSVEHAIWENPGSAAMRRILPRAGHRPGRERTPRAPFLTVARNTARRPDHPHRRPLRLRCARRGTGSAESPLVRLTPARRAPGPLRLRRTARDAP